MDLPAIDPLVSLPALDHPELLAPAVAAALAGWPLASAVAVVEIDPDVADTATMMATFDLPPTTGANCVIVGGRRSGQERVAACVVRADQRVDVNSVVKRTLDVRGASFLPVERAVEESAMEYGGITPLGLPPQWRVLIDAAVADMPVAIIGSGVRRSKLLLRGELLCQVPGAELVTGLGR